MATCINKAKFGMYCQRLSERPRLMKQVLVSRASDVPVDNRHRSDARKATYVPKMPVEDELSLCEAKAEKTTEPTDIGRILEQEFMERFDELEGDLEEVKFPVLRASHPGGCIFKTHQLGALPRTKLRHTAATERHPFYLKDPNSPAPLYSCYYDKHLTDFFNRPVILKKLKQQRIITEDLYIREPYKIFKEYIRRKKLPFGTNTVPPALPPSPKIKQRDYADSEIKQFLDTKFNLGSDRVEELYSGKRMSIGNANIDPVELEGADKTPISSPLPSLRCNTPAKLAKLEKEYQLELHNNRMNVVVLNRTMLELLKKSTTLEQRLIKEKRLDDNKKQIQLNFEESRLEKLQTTFIKKKNATFDKLKEKAETDLAHDIETNKNVRNMKKRFAELFIQVRMEEKEKKEDRRRTEQKKKKAHNKWLLKQRNDRKEVLDAKNKKMVEAQIKMVAMITADSTGKIAQLQLKCEYYDDHYQTIKEENKQLSEKLIKLRKLQKSMQPGNLDALNY